MEFDLLTDGLYGPFELHQPSLVSSLITELNHMKGSFQNVHTKSAACRALLSSSELAHAITDCFGDNLKIWRTNSFKKVAGSGEVAWHHDRHFEDGHEPINFGNLENHFSVLIALTDMDAETGIMEFIPGSHRHEAWPERDIRPFHKRELSEHFYTVPDSLLAKRIKMPLKKGQCLLFHSGLLHRSLPAAADAGTRYSLVARLCTRNTMIPSELAAFEDTFRYPFASSYVPALAGRLAIVTGGTRGIGYAIAKALLLEGANVCITGRDSDRLATSVAKLAAEFGGGRVYGEVADAASAPQMEKVFNTFTLRFGEPAVVFANAAANQVHGPVANSEPEQWNAEVAGNIAATYNTIKLAAGAMQRNGGNIIVLGSGIGHTGAANCSAYAAAKGASWALTQALAKELAPNNINVNELVPGPVKTDMNPGAEGPVWKEPQELATIALLLATQNTNNGATGQSWAVKRT